MDALFRDNRSNKLVRRHVKGRIPHLYAFHFRQTRGRIYYLGRIAFFNDDFIAGLKFAIESRTWRDDVERDIELMRKHCNAARSDLVARVSVASNTVRTDEDPLHFACRHQSRDHVVAYERNGNVVIRAFPNG